MNGSGDPHARGYRLGADDFPATVGGVRPATVAQWRIDEKIRQMRAAPEDVTREDLVTLARHVLGRRWDHWTRDSGPKSERAIALELVRHGQPEARDVGQPMRSLVLLALDESAHAAEPT